MTWLLVAVGGALGATARFVTDGEMKTRRATTWPLATFLINVVGAFVLGALTAHPHPSWTGALLVTGFCGGFTTFSTVSVETVTLLRSRRGITAAAYAVGTVLACAAAIAGAHQVF